jgi:hypothetical protein
VLAINTPIVPLNVHSIDILMSHEARKSSMQKLAYIDSTTVYEMALLDLYVALRNFPHHANISCLFHHLFLDGAVCNDSMHSPNDFDTLAVAASANVTLPCYTRRNYCDRPSYLLKNCSH